MTHLRTITRLNNSMKNQIELPRYLPEVKRNQINYKLVEINIGTLFEHTLIFAEPYAANSNFISYLFEHAADPAITPLFLIKYEADLNNIHMRSILHIITDCNKYERLNRRHWGPGVDTGKFYDITNQDKLLIPMKQTVISWIKSHINRTI